MKTFITTYSVYRVFGSLAVAIFLLAAFSSCNHDADPSAGPNLVDRFGPFAVVDTVTISTTTVDFSAGETVVFNGEFNKNIDWVIRIEGLESGSVKRIEGFDRFISADNATWDGGTTQLPIFREEECRVTISVPEEPDYGDTLFVTITGTKVYEGSVFADFEQPGGQNFEFGNFEFEFTNRVGRQNDIPAGEGEWYFLLEGTDDVVPNFFVGLVNIKSTIMGETYAVLPTTVPSQLYFNCFMWHDGSPHGIAIIQFAFDSNDNGVFDDGVDQLFPFETPLNWVGWRHFHFNMAELGMTQENLQKLVSIRLVLISDLNAQPSPPLEVRFGIDYMTFTQGQRLQL